MKKNFIKKIAVMSIATCTMISSHSLAATSNSGNDLKMTDVYVRGNGYTSVVKGYKELSNKTISVLVTRMLKDDSDASEYRYSWWQAVNTTDSIVLNAGVKATKGTVCKIALSQKTSTKKKVSVNAKGNVDDLDTIVSGYIYDFNK